MQMYDSAAQTCLTYSASPLDPVGELDRLLFQFNSAHTQCPHNIIQLACQQQGAVLDQFLINFDPLDIPDDVLHHHQDLAEISTELAQIAALPDMLGFVSHDDLIGSDLDEFLRYFDSMPDLDLAQPLSPPSSSDSDSSTSSSDFVDQDSSSSAASPAPSNLKRRSSEDDEDEALDKKEANKKAAIRYRSKKLKEKDVLFEECAMYAQRNEAKKLRIGDLQTEIDLIKNLLMSALMAKNAKR